jgi:cold shock CspA family protein
LDSARTVILQTLPSLTLLRLIHDRFGHGIAAASLVLAFAFPRQRSTIQLQFEKLARTPPHLWSIPCTVRFRSFLPQRAFGFIHGEDGNDYFFHLSDVAGSVQLVPSQTVQFQPTSRPKGLAARFVQPGPMAQFIQVGPSQFIMRWQNCVKGYETLQELGAASGEHQDGATCAAHLPRGVR